MRAWIQNHYQCRPWSPVKQRASLVVPQVVQHPLLMQQPDIESGRGFVLYRLSVVTVRVVEQSLEPKQTEQTCTSRSSTLKRHPAPSSQVPKYARTSTSSYTGRKNANNASYLMKNKRRAQLQCWRTQGARSRSFLHASGSLQDCTPIVSISQSLRSNS